jgi:flavin reductase (DIM6/NTAB) family NADH-FMN oxidoreductase RutF
MQKESLDLNVMWHVDALLQVFPITIVTTVDKEGRINAAPYSLVVPFCSSPRNPQVLLMTNKNWHTARNIEATGEFVLNYPRADHLQDITRTSHFYPSGVNELAYTAFTTMPARFVRPPRIVECHQHIECRVHNIIRPSNFQLNIIAQVLDISADQGLYALSRFERAQAVNAPVYLGMDEERGHIYGKVGELTAEPFESGMDVKKKVA